MSSHGCAEHGQQGRREEGGAGEEQSSQSRSPLPAPAGASHPSAKELIGWCRNELNKEFPCMCYRKARQRETGGERERETE